MKQDTKYRLRDSEGKEYIIIDSEKVDMQEELNKMITKQMKEIERLNNIIEVQKSKLLMIKGIINTPRALDSSLAYVMVKSHIQEVLNGSLGIDIGSDKE